MRLLTLLARTAATLVSLGTGTILVLIGAQVLSLNYVESFLRSNTAVPVLLAVGGVFVLGALHFLLNIFRQRREQTRFSQQGEWGKIHISPPAIHDLIAAILRQEIGLETFRIHLKHQGQGVAVRVSTTLSVDSKVAELGEQIQDVLARRIVERTGVPVASVSVVVGGATEAESDIEEETRVQIS